MEGAKDEEIEWTGLGGWECDGFVEEGQWESVGVGADGE